MPNNDFAINELKKRMGLLERNILSVMQNLNTTNAELNRMLITLASKEEFKDLSTPVNPNQVLQHHQHQQQQQSMNQSLQDMLPQQPVARRRGPATGSRGRSAKIINN